MTSWDQKKPQMKSLRCNDEQKCFGLMSLFILTIIFKDMDIQRQKMHVDSMEKQVDGRDNSMIS